MTRSNEQLTLDESIDKKISLIVTLQVTLLGVKNVLVQGFPFLLEINTKLNILNLSIVTICYIYAIKLLLHRKLSKEATLFVAIIVSTILFSLIVFPNNIPCILEISLRWIVVCFITGYIVAKLRSLIWLQKYMLLSSYILTLSCMCFCVIVSILGKIATASNEEADQSPYSLSMSYVALWAAMWQIHAYVKQGKKIALLFACITVAIIVMFGSRNPLIAIAVYMIIEIIDKTKDKGLYHKLFYRILLLLIGVLALFWKQTIIYLFLLFESFGFHSRSINVIYDATVNDTDMTSGRNDIHDTLLNLIFEHPFLGMGICGDVVNMHEKAHSFYLSIYATYGLIFGTFILFFIIRQCLLAFQKSRRLNHQILVMFMCMVFPRGFSTGDIWENDVFWFMMGVVFMILHSKKVKCIGYAYPVNNIN